MAPLQDLVDKEVARRGLMPDVARFASDEEFQKFINDQHAERWNGGDYTLSPQFRERPNYFDWEDKNKPWEKQRMSPGIYKAFKEAGGTDSEIGHLHAYVIGEEGVKRDGSKYALASEDITKLTNKAIESENPQIWFRPTETLYRGGRAPANSRSPEIGDIVEFNRFRSTTPNLGTALRFSNTYYRDIGKEDEYFGKDSRPRFEVIEPLHGGLKVDTSEHEVILKPAKFEVIDKKVLPPMPIEKRVERDMWGNAVEVDPETLRAYRTEYGFDTDIEYLKYKQIYGMDPAAVALKGGADLLRRNLAGAATGAAMAATSPEIAQQVGRGQYRQAAKGVLRDTALGAVGEAGIRSLAPAVTRHAPAVARAAAPAMRFAAPAAIGAALFNQGKTGSLTDVVLNKAAAVVPGLKPNPRNDLGRRAGNELSYSLRELRNGRVPYSGPPPSRPQSRPSSVASRPQAGPRRSFWSAAGNELTYIRNRLKGGQIPYTRKTTNQFR